MKCIGRPIVYVKLSRKGGRVRSVYMHRLLRTEWTSQKDFQSTKLLDFVIFCEIRKISFV